MVEHQTLFGHWLKQRRKELDLTQFDLAERVGCSEITIQKIEAAVRKPSRQVAQLLADVLGIPADEQAAFVRYARREPDHDEGTTLPFADDENKDRTPWRSLHLGQTNLPAVLTPLIGREQDEEELHSLLLRKGVRLLTLIGPPGIGKTRLGIEVAADLLEQFEDGVFFVGLAPVSERHMVIPAIAGALEVREAGATSLRDNLFAYVRGRRMLLLLDNFEHVLDAGVDVVALLEASPWLKVLVTSREALHVRGEHPFSVPPLTLPDQKQPLDLPALAQNPAVELFLERARAASPGFTLTQENAKAVAAICATLEGLPLAIELAAARTNLLFLSEILTALHSRLKLLVGGWRDLTPRHQTLRNAIGWSYDLLEPGEQMLFARLGTFVGGCTLEAVEMVCNAASDLPMEVPVTIESLLNKSLLLRGGESEVETRFLLLETIREYALERLNISGEANDIERLHAAYYLNLVEEAEAQQHGPQRTLRLARLDRDYGNLSAALERTLRWHESLTALRLANALYWYWDTRNLMTEGRRWLEGALEKSQGAPDALRAKALFGAGELAFWQTDHERAQSALEESLSLYRRIGDKEGSAEALDMLGLLLRETGDSAASIRLHEESLRLRQEVGDHRGTAYTLSQLGKAALYAADYERSVHYFAQGLALRREIGNLNGIAASLNMLGWVMVHQGNYGEACTYFEEGLQVCRQLGDEHIEASMLKGLGYALLLQEEQPISRVRELFAESLSIFRAIGDMVNVIEGVEAFAALASVKWNLDRLSGVEQTEEAGRAVKLFSAAEALRDAIGAPTSLSNQLLYGRLMYQVRSQLSETVYERLCKEGREMTMEQVIDCTIKDQGRFSIPADPI